MGFSHHGRYHALSKGIMVGLRNRCVPCRHRSKIVQVTDGSKSYPRCHEVPISTSDELAGHGQLFTV